MNIEQIEQNVIAWASDRNLLTPENDRNQALKLVEEVGELCRAVLLNNQPDVVDAIGDCMVVLTILARQRGKSLRECYLSAWETIRNRTGKTVNGTFVKEG